MGTCKGRCYATRHISHDERGPDERAIIAKYCVQVAILMPSHEKIDVITGFVEWLLVRSDGFLSNEGQELN